MFGIKNCDTMKKAMTWLDSHGIPFEFVDYKKSDVVADRLPRWIQSVGWEVLLNRRGLMWKKLSEAEREDVDSAKASELMCRYPVLMKRPVLEWKDQLIVGFDAARYADFFGKR